MKKNLTMIMTVMLALVVTTAWADLDPRANFGTCGFTSVEETWEPDASGTLVKRVTYVSQCDTPGVGDETITITTEEWDGVSLVTTEVREAVRTVTLGVYYTTTEIYDGSMALTGKEEHVFDKYASDPDIWYQEWTDYDWNGVSYDVTGATTRTAEQLPGDEVDVTFIYYDTTFRADPIIPDDAPILGASSSSVLPPPGKAIDTGDTYINLGRMYERVYNTIRATVNTEVEGTRMLAATGLPESRTLLPSGLYISGVIKGDRLDDPNLPDFNGFFTRWVKWSNDVSGNLNVILGWTSDRDLNEPTSDWWQARVKQYPDGTLESIENAHRSGLTEVDHYDTYTVLNNMYMIESQTVKNFDWDELNPGDFTQTTTVTGSFGATTSYGVWTVVFD
jgi:hypothetical protein